MILSKISRLIFTESQLKARWEATKKGKDFSEATHEELIELTLKMYKETSYHDLAHHILGAGYRSLDEMEGKTLVEKSIASDIHVEVIDTEQAGDATTLVLDRVLKLECEACHFTFYVDDVNVSLGQLKCPRCQGEVRPISSEKKTKKVEGTF